MTRRRGRRSGPTDTRAGDQGPADSCRSRRPNRFSPPTFSASARTPIRTTIGSPWARPSVVEIDRREVDSVDGRPHLGDEPALQHTELRVLLLPPRGRQPSALAAEVGRARPLAQRDPVDPDRDVTGPVEVVQRRLTADLSGQLHRLDAGSGRDAIRKPVFHVAHSEPEQLRVEPVGFVERRRIIHEPDQAGRADQAAGRFDREVGVSADRHLDVDGVVRVVDRRAAGRRSARRTSGRKPSGVPGLPDAAPCGAGLPARAP